MVAPWRLYLLLTLAVGVISFAAILIKLLEAVPALAIAAWRLSLAGAVLAPWTLARARPGLRALRGERRWVALSAGALALHFASWIWSLKFTSVASSVVLVTTNPLWVGLGAHFFLKERLTPALSGGIALSLAGGVLIGYGDLRFSGAALWGDALALLGALSGSVYFLVGRRLRPRTALEAYLLPVYAGAALLLVLACLVTGTPLTGFSGRDHLFLVLLALGPQLIGHSTLNWALGYLSAGAVAVAILGEPVGSALLAWTLLDELLHANQLVGGALILAGVYLALRGEGRLARR